MKEAIITEIRYAYDEWLMEKCPEDIHSREDLMELVEQGYMLDEFLKEIKEEI